MVIIFIDTESGLEYNFSFREDVLRLRVDLAKKGFFRPRENRKYLKWFDRKIKPEEFLEFYGSVKLFNAMLKRKKTGKLRRKEELN